MNWTEAQHVTVRENWGKISAAEIGKLIDKTRNAVIGHAHRSGFEALTRSPTGRPKKPRPPRPVLQFKVRTPPVAARTPEQDKLIPIEQRKTLRELTDKTCRWPVGDPGTSEFFFCGAVPLETSPYCAGHHAVSVVACESPKQRGYHATLQPAA